MTQPTHILNGRPVVTRPDKHGLMVIYCDTGFPRWEHLSENEFRRQAEIHPENVLTHQPKLV